jgi:mannose-6-phosphate isomerase-like protein (cupin superfamily)
MQIGNPKRFGGQLQGSEVMPDAAKPDEAGQAYTIGAHDSRPWGEWLVIDAGAGFAVKRITVLPGQRLSLQRHRHRAEQWVVVAGTALVTCGDAVLTLTAGESVRIAQGETHRVENRGTETVVFIEVQTGSVLSEDDIERLHDDYGRVAAP